MARVKRVAAVVAAAMIVLAAAEGLARRIEPGLSSAGDWPKGGISEQFDSVSVIAEGTPVDVVFVGSSMMEKAVDPRQFTSRTGLSSFNAALPASTNFLLEPWLREVLVPMLHPSVVAIGLASRDFNDNAIGPGAALEALLTAPGYKTLVGKDWLTRLDRLASRHSALFRIRRSAREPSAIADAWNRPRPAVKTLNCPPAKRAYERYTVDRTVARYPHTLLRDYSAGGRQTRALTRTITFLKRNKIRVFLLRLPTSPDYIGLHPKPAANLADFDQAFDRVVSSTHPTVIDGRSLTDRSNFRDPIHMNCNGTSKFTTLLAEEWLALEP